MLAAKLVAALGIWFHPDTYAATPVLIPFAIRDAKARKSNNPNGVEEWGSPNSFGYFRDDNSLVKNLPRTLPIISPLSDIYSGETLGNGFVASHVWRTTTVPGDKPVLASRLPETYSFLPNLVWLPAQVSKLTDREGSFTQIYLQALASKIYRNVEVPARFKPLVDRIWTRLPVPEGIPAQGLPDITELNFFQHSQQFVEKRKASIQSVITAVDCILKGQAIEKTISSRFTTGLPKVIPPELQRMRSYLSECI
ncbi:MAG: hypothetical protein JNM27_08640 [Leptospirales bacterium]|nr:hypothetical protein [Leptospirales bacterium]